MDLRIVNTCNNNCLYCLENSYRTKEKYEDFSDICSKIDSTNDEIINFYWWNPLLHPQIFDILKYVSKKWFSSVWLLTNTYFLDELSLEKLKFFWLTSIWFYFNSFFQEKHKLISWNWIDLSTLVKNIEKISKSWIFYKAIIHINKQNLDLLYRDIYILNKKFWVKNFEFINYFPFDKPYENKDILEYDFNQNREHINNIFKIINKLDLWVKFSKFPKDFFWEYTNFYDFERGILSQIWDEDIDRLGEETAFCYLENRCKTCFIKDNCRLYEK